MRGFTVLCLAVAITRVALSETAYVPDAAYKHVTDAPTFPDSYEMVYTFSMPYVKTVQPQGLSYDIHVWYDKDQDMMRVDALEGVDSTIYTPDYEYSVVPRINVSVCSIFKRGGGGGPVASSSQQQSLSSTAGAQHMLHSSGALPNLDDWQALGETTIDGQRALMWQLQQRHAGKVSTYTFYISPEGAPIKMHSVGDDLLEGSHYDEYLYDWKSFKAGPVDPAVFTPPELCQQLGSSRAAAAAAAATGSRSTVALQLLALLPASHVASPGHSLYSALARAYSWQHDSAAHAQEALEQLAAAHTRVKQWNTQVAVSSSSGSSSQGQLFTQRLNHFAHLSQQQFEQLLLPNKRRQPVERTKANGFRPLGTFKKVLAKGKLPRHVDWRGSPAELGVKDQAQCGSCWAFGATGAMEAAWALATGQARSFSEQQLMDCSWDYGHNYACDGGDYQPALTYLAEAGGAALEADYPYQGLDNFCRAGNASRAGHFSGYLDVASRDEEALMEALYSHGPVAVAVDASLDNFRFYAEGVYRDKRCSHKSRDLDHAVLLVGYGTTQEGIDYWLVRNSWSKLWGEDGYFKVERGPGDCGIATDPMVAVVEQSHVVPGMAEKLREGLAARGRMGGAGGAAVAAK